MRHTIGGTPMKSCQAIFIPGLNACRTGLGIHPVPVTSPVISTAYLCNQCKNKYEGEQ